MKRRNRSCDLLTNVRMVCYHSEMDMRKQDILTLKNFNKLDLESFERILQKIGVMIRAELNLRGIASPNIGLMRKLTQRDIETGVIELVIQIDRPWSNQSWQDFTVKLNQLLKSRLRFTIDVFRINFKG